MTRINAIPVDLLLDEWLIAEYRELKRIPNKIREGKYRPGRLPESYRMGAGHERFFIDKLLFLKIRHDEIRDEMWARFGKEYHIRVEVYDLPEYLQNDWEPDKYDHRENVIRLYERFRDRTSDYHFYSRVVSESDFNSLYREFI